MWTRLELRWCESMERIESERVIMTIDWEKPIMLAITNESVRYVGSYTNSCGFRRHLIAKARGQWEDLLHFDRNGRAISGSYQICNQPELDSTRDVCSCNRRKKEPEANDKQDQPDQPKVDSDGMQDVELEKDLVHLLNHRSRENRSDTPDFILAEYLMGCLKVFEMAANQRDFWNKGVGE